ncbi:MAG: PAS domain-containing protein, partial [Thiotrichaceae bacterium]|nr:PAS domain-containing protein [Thiotrichaceae bacterium]
MSEAFAVDITGLSPPAVSQIVENVPRALPLPPFDHVPEVSWSDIWVTNKAFIIFSTFSLVIIAFLLWLLTYRNFQLRTNREKLIDAIASQDAILSAIPELMFELDLDGRYLNVWARNPGELIATRSLMLGKTVSEMMPEESATIVLDALKEAKRTGHSSGQQIYLSTPEGGMWFELSISLKSRHEDSPRFIMLSRDITYQKESAKKLAVSQERFRGLFENMADGVAIYKAVDDGTDFEFIDFNRAGEKIEGISREELVGHKVTEKFSGIKEMGLLDVLQRVWRTGQSELFPVSKYSDDRLIRWRDNFVYRLDSGEIVAIYSDVTAHKVAEQKLQDSESQMKQVLQTVPDIMWLKDIDGVYMACNALFERFIGLNESEIIGKTDYDLVDRDLAEHFIQHDKAAIQANQAVINEEWIIYADNGQKALLETTTIPFKADNKVMGVLGVGHEITHRHEAEEAQRLASSVFEHSQ